MVNANMLRGKIAEAGLNQKQLADRIGMSTNTLSNKINGKQDFTTSEAVTICGVLGITDNSVKAHIFLA